MQLDHVLIAVPELEAAARELEERHGLTSVEGGRHAGWGTANRIVPLGDTYLELIAVVDEEEAAGSVFGGWIADGLRSGLGRPLGWVARTDRIDEVADRLGLTVSSGSRRAGDGRELQWRLAGAEQAAAEPCLPFFVEWGEGTPHPGRAPAVHPAGEVGLTGVRLSGDPERVERWLTAELPVVIVPGPPAVTAVVLEMGEGELVLEGL
ncbi:MAG TPA: VOC family protein [Thermoleophilaceae bacterium]